MARIIYFFQNTGLFGITKNERKNIFIMAVYLDSLKKLIEYNILTFSVGNCQLLK